MTSYDIGPGNGLAALDLTLGTPDPKTGKPFNALRALDEVSRMVHEVDAIAGREMQNVPPPVANSIKLLLMGVGVLAAVLRDRVVTEPIEVLDREDSRQPGQVGRPDPALRPGVDRGAVDPILEPLPKERDRGSV